MSQVFADFLGASFSLDETAIVDVPIPLRLYESYQAEKLRGLELPASVL
jgi:predicted RNase H-like nuclease